jgi:hypothetical protein
VPCPKGPERLWATYRVKVELEASRRVCTALTGISSAYSRKRLSSRQLFLLLYVVRCREHFSPIILLLENESEPWRFDVCCTIPL